MTRIVILAELVRAAGNMVIRPRASYWLPLLLVAIPMAALPIAAIIEGDVVLGTIVLALIALIPAYNGWSALDINESRISFYRYGRRVWCLPNNGLSVSLGLGGELPLFRYYHVTSPKGEVGTFPKNMLTDFQTGHVRKGY
jgi:hypothetical protein